MVAMEMTALQKHRVDRESPRLTLVPPVPRGAVRARDERSAAPLCAVLAVMVALSVVVASVTSCAQAARAQASIEGASWERHVVQSGETVWELAEASGCDADIQTVVSAIMDHNGLEGAAVTAGQVLLIPNVG